MFSTHVEHTYPSLNPSSFQLFDLVYREETLLNVIKSVTRNGRSIVLTAVLALILVYLFSIVGYIFFKDDFILAVDRIPNKTLGTSKCTFSFLSFHFTCQPLTTKWKDWNTCWMSVKINVVKVSFNAILDFNLFLTTPTLTSPTIYKRCHY